MASVCSFSQSSANRSLSVNVGIWRGYNSIANKPANFTTKGVGMPGVAIAYEQQKGKFVYGITADFADINYSTQSKKDVSFDSNGVVGIGIADE